MAINPEVVYLLKQPELSILRRNCTDIYGGDSGYIMLFVGAGGHLLLDKAGKGEAISDAQMYFIPHGTFVSIKAMDNDLDILVIHFRAHTSLCNGLCPSIFKTTKATKQASDSKIRLKKVKAHPTFLAISSGIDIWLKSIIHLSTYTTLPLSSYDNKVDELFRLIKLDYSPEEANLFLRYYHCQIVSFRERIMKNLNAKMEVSDLYQIGEEMGLNEATFKRAFIGEFEQSPREWLTEQRGRMIYKELALTDKPFKLLSEDYGFCSLSHFGVFCKINLGDSPRNIRERIQNSSK